MLKRWKTDVFMKSMQFYPNTAIKNREKTTLKVYNIPAIFHGMTSCRDKLSLRIRAPLSC